MSNGNGHRWSKFWWRDHQGDAALRACSLAARGYWMELLCVAHEAEKVGHVLINGKKPNGRQLAAIAGCTEREAKKHEAELEEAGVFSRLPDGTIYSRRMVKDAAASEAGREHIEKRWNGAKPPDPPNRVPIREPSSQPISEPISQASSPPGRAPIFPPDPPYQEAEEDTEEKKASKFSSLTYTSPVLARVAAACETPPAGTFGAEPEPEPASNALQFATQNIVGKVARKLESSGKSPPGKRAHLTVVQQIDAVLRGPVLDEEALVGDIMPPIRGPLPPQRTVAEQLAALGFPQHTIEATP
jgi:hypothetical protein